MKKFEAVRESITAYPNSGYAGGDRVRVAITDTLSGEEEFWVELSPSDAIEFAKEVVRSAHTAMGEEVEDVGFYTFGPDLDSEY